jgi:anti-sigma-K factor RskA
MELDGHDGVQELLGAYALDAVDPDEAELVERHLAVCARCRSEVAEYREVAGLMAYPGAPAPEGVWDRIAGKLQETPPPLSLVPQQSGQGAGATALENRRRSVGMRIVAVAAAAVIAVVAVLGVEVARLNRRTDRLPAVWTAHAKQAAWLVAISNSNARRVTLRSPDEQRWIQAVVLPDGTSFLGPTNLAGLSRDQTYQLWGVVGGERVSLGVIGTDPAYQQFSTPALVAALAVTVERAGGVVAPTKTPAVLTSLPRV